MKRYLVFAGPIYYPAGGWVDFVKAFDNIQDARECARTHGTGSYNWSHVVDTETMEEV